VIDLEALGWSSFFAVRGLPGGGQPARVFADLRAAFEVVFPGGTLLARLPGRLRHLRPAVGDWVLVDCERAGAAVIGALLDRRTVLVRQAAGAATARQVIAANVDLAFVMTALDGDLSQRRLERYVAAVAQGGIRPVILVNKADLGSDGEAALALAGEAAPGTPVHLLSARDGLGVEAVRSYVGPGVTAVLLGSSGVGKSTLVNRLLGTEAQRTAAVRARDGRGVHTTTSRRLLPLPGGGLLLDEPGMRELQLWEADAGLAAVFPDLHELASGCRFRDCRHDGEPGCAVRAAVEAGLLPAERLEGARKLEREERHQRARTDVAARLEEKRRWREIHRAQRRFHRE
jgi:ribosome biogenesis GTPase / thiamine phosphate phosphatase